MLQGVQAMTEAAQQCVCAFAVEDYLQNHLLQVRAGVFFFSLSHKLTLMPALQAGVLWHMLILLFKYDYTLDEAGVETDDQTHEQVCERLWSVRTGLHKSPT